MIGIYRIYEKHLTDAGYEDIHTGLKIITARHSIHIVIVLHVCASFLCRIDFFYC